MDCLMMEKAALIMAWLATQAAAVANTNTNCKQTSSQRHYMKARYISTRPPCRATSSALHILHTDRFELYRLLKAQ